MPQKNGFYRSMMKLKVYSTLIFVLLLSFVVNAQTTIAGVVINGVTKAPMQGVEVYAKQDVKTVYTDAAGKFNIVLNTPNQELVFINFGFEIYEQSIDLSTSGSTNVYLQPLSQQLSEIVIDQQKQKVFGIKNLKDVEGTAIYAGKKTEVVLVDQLVTNKASGNPRQAYAQVSGLNIFETEDAGLQLNIGGRGLDPNRSANFNTRQNGYDISADVLGYPESYYSPSLEALDEIQIIRGAASLQYGTQFGGLVNFKLKKPNPTKELEWISRVGGGSFGLVNLFNSFSGTIKKASYYAFHQYKKGDGFRDNSDFESQNLYGNIGYQFNKKTKLTFESTYLKYLAQQAGGLTDEQFEIDSNLSTRSRNYFAVDWLLLNLKLEHEFNSQTKASLNFFKMNASRKALGFNSVRIEVADDDFDQSRDLLIGDFNNWGAEGRLLTRYNLFNKKSVFLIGAKYYQSKNEAQQGVGDNGTSADFSFYNDEFPNSDVNKFYYEYPNLNVSLFGENIFQISDAFSVTPGFRLEYINTQSDGFFSETILSNSGVVLETNTKEDSNGTERTFILFGVGLSYKPSNEIELFANFSQNYRSVTFTDLIGDASVEVDPNLEDETGYTADIGVRGQLSSYLRYDVNVFSLLYDNKIGISSDRDENDNFVQFRSNISGAQVYGLESLFTMNFSNWLLPAKTSFHWQQFLNTSYTYSEYINDGGSNKSIKGNQVEFVPIWNMKTGLELGYKNLKTSLQYTYVSQQFTDFENTLVEEIVFPQDKGVKGEIPAYSILDFSTQYTYKKWTLEAGVNNVLDESYFTRRATGYPGPGIIPSAPRNFYAVLQFKF